MAVRPSAAEERAQFGECGGGEGEEARYFAGRSGGAGAGRRRLGHIDKLEKQVSFSLGSDMEHAPTQGQDGRFF